MLAGQCCSVAVASVEVPAKEGLWRVGEGGMVVGSPENADLLLLLLLLSLLLLAGDMEREGCTNANEVETVETLPGDDSYELGFAEEGDFGGGERARTGE